MEEPRDIPLTDQLTERNSPLPPPPFTYVKTEDENLATIKIHKPKWESKKAEIETAQKEREAKDWFTARYGREKGTPTEQFEVSLGENKTITVYNYNKDASFTPQHLKELQNTLQKLAIHFPQALEKIHWILTDDKQEINYLGEAANGRSYPSWKTFSYSPTGTSLQEFRIPGVSTFSGVLTHELAHFLQENRSVYEWGNLFPRSSCSDFPKQWKRLPPPKDKNIPPHLKRPYYQNRTTGKISRTNDFAKQPEQCVSDYAALISWSEDFAESVTAYIHNPELLKRVSPQKFAFIEKLDAKGDLPTQVEITKIENIKLPEVKPETVYYYIKKEYSSWIKTNK